VYYLHYLPANKLYVSTNTIKILPKLLKGQTELGKRVEVTETFTKEQITEYSEKQFVFQNRGQLLLILLNNPCRL
jgi:hypothetical protein